MNPYKSAESFATAYEAYNDDLIQSQLGGNEPSSSQRGRALTPEESWEAAEDYYASQRQPVKKIMAETLPITTGLMQGGNDMEAFARLAPEQKNALVQWAKQNGIAKYVGSDNVSIVRQAWRNRGR